jgi:hypothetical protein
MSGPGPYPCATCKHSEIPEWEQPCADCMRLSEGSDHYEEQEPVDG